MRINVSELKKETGQRINVPVQITLESVELSGQPVEFNRPFTGEAEIWNVGDRLLVRAELAGEAVVQCSRCLTPFALPLEVSFEEEFMEGSPSQQTHTERDDEDEDDDEGLDQQRTITYYTGDEIDLTDSLRDNVLLELPMQAVCKEECKGLCITCGSNLNEGACGCQEDEPQVVDSRFAVLKDLLRKPDSNK